MKLIEFLGLPGSGKTTLVPFINSVMAKNGHTVFNRQDVRLLHVCGGYKKFRIVQKLPSFFTKALVKVFFKLNHTESFYTEKFIEKYPDLVAYVLKTSAKNGVNEKVRKNSIRWFLSLGAIYELAQEIMPSNAYLLLDEGFCQKVLNLFVSVHKDPNLDKVKKYLEMIPQPDTILFIQTDPTLAFDRMKVRGRAIKRLFNASDDELKTFLVNAKISMDFVTQHLGSSLSRLVILDNTQEFVSGKDTISRKLNDSFSTHPVVS
ncbi:MAG: AAA family ATPase [Bacteroidia bacterium]|nr:AAA family ATPase [Bacteroidia bacterium]